MRKLAISMIIFLMLSVNVYANLEIVVKPDKRWGPAPTSNIKKLCENVADHFNNALRDKHKVKGKITIVYNEGYPVVFGTGFFPEQTSTNHKIGLSQSDTYWDAFTYEFAHEFCHIIHKYWLSPSANDSNQWFQESIAVMASIWAIKEMSETWATHPPYANWANYRHHLKWYANALLKRDEVQYIGTGKEWLAEFENKQRKMIEFHYDTLSQLGHKFLPIFEENPEAWNAVSQMPTSQSKMSIYMKEWYRNVDIQDKQYVKAMADIMGIDVDLSQTNVYVMEDGIPLTFTDFSGNALVPINSIEEWDGWTQGIWEKTPDGIITSKPNGYLNFSNSDNWNHWIYCHAPSILKYDISDMNVTQFVSYFGLTNPGCGGPTMQIIARSDGVEIYKSNILGLDDNNTAIEFNIPNGTNILEIEVDELNWNGCDHYVFGEPKLLINGKTNNIIYCDIDGNGYVDLSDVEVPPFI